MRRRDLKKTPGSAAVRRPVSRVRSGPRDQRTTITPDYRGAPGVIQVARRDSPRLISEFSTRRRALKIVDRVRFPISRDQLFLGRCIGEFSHQIVDLGAIALMDGDLNLVKQGVDPLSPRRGSLLL